MGQVKALLTAAQQAEDGLQALMGELQALAIGYGPHARPVDGDTDRAELARIFAELARKAERILVVVEEVTPLR